MTEKELHRLSRQDLLQLLLAQSKEVARQRAVIEELKNNAEKDHELIDRLKARLDEKDETIAHLKRRLDAKDETMNKLKADAEDMSGTMEFLRSRLDEKDAALDAARARLDLLTGVSTSVRSGKNAEERLQELKKQVAREESAEAEQRKEEA